MPRRATPSDAQQPPTDLAARARRLQSLARESEQNYQRSNLAQGLATRQAEFKSVVDRAEALRRTRELLTSAGIASPISLPVFVDLSGHVLEVQRRFTNDPGSLTEPGAYRGADITRALEATAQGLLQSWQRHVRAVGHTRLVGIFERFGRHEVAQRLRTIGAELERLSAVLPRRVEDVHRVSELKAAGLEAIRRSQLDEDLDFLEQAIDQGAPLSTLLDDPERIERLRRRGIIDVLRVIAS